jgi:N-acetylmuramoyl-L-alanine amidase
MEKVEIMRTKIMFDPGHGGKDPGAIGHYEIVHRDVPYGHNNYEDVEVKEKDLTLRIGRYIRRLIVRRNYPILPLLTRNRDYYVSLKKRCFDANYMVTPSGSVMSADYFVSIHHNARPRPGKYGIELEAWHCPGSAIGYKLSEVILNEVLKYLNQYSDMPVWNRGVKSKAFYVLKHTKMPATLLELGFVSDSEEAKFLHKRRSQKILAVGIVNGVMRYLDPNYTYVG